MKEIIKKYPLVFNVLKNVKRTFMIIWVYMCKIAYVLFKQKSESVLEFKNNNNGDRCFIIATGPSLTLEDLKMVEKEYTFSMNSIVNIFDKTDFRPTFYLLQDGIVEKRIRNKLIEFDICNVCKTFIGINNLYGHKVSISRSIKKTYYKKAYWYNLNFLYHCLSSFYNPDSAKVYFATDCSKEMYDGFTVTYSAIELAVYMGFKEIYLLGCDTNFSGHVGEKAGMNNTKNFEPAYMMIKAYESAKKYAEENGVKIFNATRGGMLECFPRVKLEEVFNGEE